MRGLLRLGTVSALLGLCGGLQAQDVWVDLGFVDEVEGLENSQTGKGDGESERVACGPAADEREARRNWGTEDPTPDWPDPMLYFNVIDPVVKAESRFRIDATVYDDPDLPDGTGLVLQYTNEDATGPGDIPNTFYPLSGLPSDPFEGSGEWIGRSWEIAHAGFRSFQQGSSDFRIMVNNGSRVCFDRVDVTVIHPTFLTDLVCEATGGDRVELSWVSHDTYDAIRVLRDGTEIASLAGDVEAYADTGVPDGRHTYEVLGVIGADSGGESCLVAVYADIEGVTVRVDLGETDDEDGLENSQTGSGDGENEALECGPPGDERPARSNWGDEDPTPDAGSPGVWPDHYFYFNVTDPAVKAQKRFRIRATVYDDPLLPPGTALDLQYTNEDAAGPADIPNTFYPQENPPARLLTGSDDWVTLEWEIERAGFRSFQQGTSDFRIHVNNGSRVCLDAVEVEVVVPTYPSDLVCAQDEDGAVTLTWTVPRTYASLKVLRDGEEIADLPVDATSYEDADPGSGLHRYEVVAVYEGEPGGSTCEIAVIGPEAPFQAPAGGWDYIYDPAPGDTDAAMRQYVPQTGLEGNLDGGWIRSGASDAWDGSTPEERSDPIADPDGPSAGGIALETLEGEGYHGEAAGVLSFEDAGDPRDAGWRDPSNRKLYLAFDVGTVAGDADIRSVLSDGATFACRFRVHPIPYSVEIVPPNGFVPDFGGKGFVSLAHREAVTAAGRGDQDLGLSMDADPQDASRGILYIGQGRHAIPLRSATEWITLWITVEDADGDPFTPEHRVEVYVNGGVAPILVDDAWDFTGSGIEGGTSLGDGAGNYLAIGLPSTGDAGAMQLDFVAFRDGVVRPGEGPEGPRFIRGDADGDGTFTIGDGIQILMRLFAGRATLDSNCESTADVDDNGVLTIGDAIALFNYLFAGGAVPAPPGPEACGLDPTPETTLGCLQYPCNARCPCP